MTPFQDINGRAWRIDLTNGTVERIRDAFGVDLLNPWTGEAIDALLNDYRRTAAILSWSVALEKEEDGAALAAGLKGEGLDNAIRAFVLEAGLFQTAPRRAALAALLEGALTMNRAVWDGVAEDLRRGAETLNGNAPSLNPGPPATACSAASTGRRSKRRKTGGNFSTSGTA